MIKKYLQKQGRYGDTELRNVNGELSHVDPQEAEIIDRFGPLGEVITQNYGSGTVNPSTGLREYYRFGQWFDNSINALMTGERTGYNSVWQPSSGNWGIFGQTAGAKAAAAKKKADDLERKREQKALADFKSLYTSGEPGATGAEDFMTSGRGNQIKWARELGYTGMTDEEYDAYMVPFDEDEYLKIQ